MANRPRLLAIKKTTTKELNALQLVKQVDETHRTLQKLTQRMVETDEYEESLAEVRHLEQFIADNSKRAEWAITADRQEQQEL